MSISPIIHGFKRAYPGDTSDDNSPKRARLDVAFAGLSETPAASESLEGRVNPVDAMDLEDGPNILHTLPVELQMEILSYLEGKPLVLYSRVSKQSYNLVQEKLFLRRIRLTQLVEKAQQVKSDICALLQVAEEQAKEDYIEEAKKTYALAKTNPDWNRDRRDQTWEHLDVSLSIEIAKAEARADDIDGAKITLVAVYEETLLFPGDGHDNQCLWMKLAQAQTELGDIDGALKTARLLVGGDLMRALNPIAQAFARAGDIVRARILFKEACDAITDPEYHSQYMKEIVQAQLEVDG